MAQYMSTLKEGEVETVFIKYSTWVFVSNRALMVPFYRAVNGTTTVVYL